MNKKINCPECQTSILATTYIALDTRRCPVCGGAPDWPAAVSYVKPRRVKRATYYGKRRTK